MKNIKVIVGVAGVILFLLSIFSVLFLFGSATESYESDPISGLFTQAVSQTLPFMDNEPRFELWDNAFLPFMKNNAIEIAILNLPESGTKLIKIVVKEKESKEIKLSLDQKDFLMSDNELKLLIPPNTLEDGKEYEFSFEISSEDETFKQTVSVIATEIKEEHAFSSSSLSPLPFQSLAASSTPPPTSSSTPPPTPSPTPTPTPAPAPTASPAPEPTPTPTPFCRALSLKLYPCKEYKQDIEGTKKHLSRILLKFYDAEKFVDSRTGKEVSKDTIEKLGLPTQCESWNRDNCFVMAGIVEASDEKAVQLCLEGQEMQSTEYIPIKPQFREKLIPKGHFQKGIVVRCLTENGEYLMSSPGLNEESVLHCYEDPDEVLECVRHEDKERNKGHSPNYACDDYHQKLLSYEIIFNQDNFEGYALCRKKMYEKIEGNKYLVVWQDVPQISNVNWKVIDKISVRRDRYHSYLHSFPCKGRSDPHVCFDMINEVYDPSLGIKNNEGPPKLLECVFESKG